MVTRSNIVFADNAPGLQASFSHAQMLRAGALGKPTPKARQEMLDCHGNWVPIPEGPSIF